jgi:hypothetical protein
MSQKSKPAPFEKSGYKGRQSKIRLLDEKSFSENDRQFILRKTRHERRAKRIKQILVLATSVIMAITLLWLWFG